MRGNSAQRRPLHWTGIGAFSSSSHTDNRALPVSKKLDAACLVLEEWVGLHKCTLDSFFVLLLDLSSLWSWSVKTERLWSLGGIPWRLFVSDHKCRKAARNQRLEYYSNWGVEV